MTSYRFGSVQVSRVQLALLVGTPIVLGLGILAYRKLTSRSTADQTDAKDVASKKDAKLKTSVPRDKVRSGREQPVEVHSKALTPIEEANKYKDKGNSCYRNAKYDEAIANYDKAIETCPKENQSDLAIFYQNRAACYEMLKNWNKVKEDCTTALKHNCRYAKAYFRRAKAHEARNEWLECLDDITATCILEMFRNNNTIMYADRILKLTGEMDAKNASCSLLLPSKSFIDIYLRAFTNDPLQKSVPIEQGEEPRGYKRANKALREQKYDQVIPACTEEIESSEAEAQYKTEALLLRGTFHLLTGAYADAQQDLEAVINNADADVTLRTYALLRRGALFVQIESKDAGMSDFEEAQRLQPDNPDVYHQRGQVHILADQLPECVADFKRAVELAPNHAMAYVQKCYAEYRTALFAQDQMGLLMAIGEFQKAVDKFPDCVDCYSLMGQVMTDQQQFAQANDFFEKAIKMAPDNATLLVHKAIMQLQWVGDIEKAVELLNRAIEMDERCEVAFETLGTIEVQRANLNRAVELFELAIKLGKSSAELRHLFALRNAAIAQINVTRKLGIDMKSITAFAQNSFEESKATHVPN